MQRFWRWWNSLFVPRAPYPRQIGPAMPVKLVWRRVQGEVAAAYATPIDMGDWEFQDTPLGFGDVLTSQGPDVRDYHVHLAQLRNGVDLDLDLDEMTDRGFG